MCLVPSRPAERSPASLAFGQHHGLFSQPHDATRPRADGDQHITLPRGGLSLAASVKNVQGLVEKHRGALAAWLLIGAKRTVCCPTPLHRMKAAHGQDGATVRRTSSIRVRVPTAGMRFHHVASLVCHDYKYKPALSSHYLVSEPLRGFSPEHNPRPPTFFL